MNIEEGIGIWIANDIWGLVVVLSDDFSVLESPQNKHHTQVRYVFKMTHSSPILLGPKRRRMYKAAVALAYGPYIKRREADIK